MANRERGELTLVTPTQTYTLRLEVGTCCELEDRTEITYDDLTARVNKGRVTELRWLLWASLQAKHADTVSTPLQATQIIESVGLRKIRTVLAAFLTLNQDDEKPKKGTAKPPVDDRPGSIWRRLYLDARVMGVPGERFWRLSLKELWLELAAGRQAQQRALDLIVTQAWWNAGLVWQKQLPRLESLLGRAKRQQSPEEARAVMEALSGSLGIPLIRIQLQPPKGKQDRGEQRH